MSQEYQNLDALDIILHNALDSLAMTVDYDAERVVNRRRRRRPTRTLNAAQNVGQPLMDTPVDVQPENIVDQPSSSSTLNAAQSVGQPLMDAAPEVNRVLDIKSEPVVDQPSSSPLSAEGNIGQPLMDMAVDVQPENIVDQPSSSSTLNAEENVGLQLIDLQANINAVPDVEDENILLTAPRSSYVKAIQFGDDNFEVIFVDGQRLASTFDCRFSQTPWFESNVRMFANGCRRRCLNLREVQLFVSGFRSHTFISLEHVLVDALTYIQPGGTLSLISYHRLQKDDVEWLEAKDFRFASVRCYPGPVDRSETHLYSVYTCVWNTRVINLAFGGF
uniref:Uncharacterized protein n=1 Tax=Panagrolaimus sp. JU765 TaxID=591449 RepID=A0AC34RFN5_9BILA